MKHSLGYTNKLLLCGLAASALSLSALSVPAWAKDKKEATPPTYEEAAAMVAQIEGTDQCTNPGEAPGDVPDGSTATEEEMATFKDAVIAYQGSVVNFQDCLEEAAKKVAEDLSDEQKVAVNVYGNHYVDQLTEAAGAYNEQAGAFKAAHPGE